MKVKINADEWYPMYSIVEDGYSEYEIDLTEDEIAIIKMAHNAIDKAQDIIIGKLYPQINA